MWLSMVRVDKGMLNINKGEWMNVLSLFDGMSCGQIALNRANIEYDDYYASEIDKYAIAVTQHNHPNTKQLGDVAKVNVKDLPKIDLLIGGSPCQGFSFAGKQLNFDDPRSKLFFEYVRVLNDIREYNPNVKFLLENVRMKKESQDIISKHLGVEPVKINSSLVSAQNRVRLYWTNISDEVKQPINKNILLADILENAFTNREKSYCIDANYGKGGNLKRYFYRSSRQITFINKGFMEGLLRNKPLINKINDVGNRFKHAWRMLTISEVEKLQTVDYGYTNTDSIPKQERYKMLGNGWTVDVIVHIFNSLKGER